MKLLATNQYKYGQISSILDQNIPRGAASSSENWHTVGEQVVLRQGSTRLGTTENSGVGKITGSIVAQRADGVEVAFRSRGRKVEYYNTTTGEWTEISSDVLPAAADGERITFDKITTVTGVQVWLNSPHAGAFKIMVANPGSITSMYDATKNYKGYIAIRGSAMWLWNARIDNKVPDLTNVYRSYLANKSATDFTQISAESIGSSGSTTYTGTLAFKAAGATRTCFEVTFTDTSETFVDDFSGNLVGSAGGTGTINYTTGAYSVTFAIAAVGAVTATYRWENSNSTGISDFTFSGTRTSGQGLVLRQSDGGSPMMDLKIYGGLYFCFHESTTWRISISADDLTLTNVIFRNNVGIPSIGAACETGEGIYYADIHTDNDPQIRRLAFDTAGVEVVPQSVSKRFKLNNHYVGLDLTDFTFDDSVSSLVGNTVLFSCKQGTSATQNNAIIVINKDSGACDVDTYLNASTLDLYGGAVLAGDAISNNSYYYYTGFDDQDDQIPNFWTGKNDNLDVNGRLKVCKKIVLEGLIGPDQNIRVYVAIDNGNFVEINDASGNPFVQGSGSYVDRTQSVNIGAFTLGRGEIGGGGSGISAYHFMRELPIGQDRFEKIQIKFEADGVGWASISQQIWKDVRMKWQKLPTKYR